MNVCHRARPVGSSWRWTTLLATVILIFVASPGGAAPGDSSLGEINLFMIFSDSYNNEGELLPYLGEIGITADRVASAATGGARTFDDVDFPHPSACDEDNGYFGCDFYGIRQIKQLDGVCRVTQSLFGSVQPTCLEDLTLDEWSICLIQFGTNDVGRGVSPEWETKYFDLSRAAFEEMLSHADSLGVRCVVATPFPLIEFSPGEVEFYPLRDQNVRDLRDWMRDTLMPLHPNHEFVDLLAAADDYRALNGDMNFTGLYTDCTLIGGGDGAGCDDGIHPGNTLNSLGDSGRAFGGRLISQATLRIRDQLRAENPVGVSTFGSMQSRRVGMLLTTFSVLIGATLLIGASLHRGRRSTKD